MNDEKIQSIVLEAISQVEQTSNPVKYAEFNYNVYEIAYKAVEIALKQETRYARDAALDMAEYKDKMNYEQLKEHEKELYEQFITSISNLYDCNDEFFYNEVNEFKKLLKVYEPD